MIKKFLEMYRMNAIATAPMHEHEYTTRNLQMVSKIERK